MAAAAQCRETLDIQSDPQEFDKWLKRQEALANRELRLDSMRVSFADIAEPQGADLEA